MSGRFGSPAVVLCGTFHRDRDQLDKDADQLREIGCAVLSPVDTSFVDELDGFVRAAHELGSSPPEIEERHLAAIAQADFIWLHCPEGYLGLSGSMELGFAKSLGIPVFARCKPGDIPLDSFVSPCDDPQDALSQYYGLTKEPVPALLQSLQTYYRRAAAERGYENETAQDCLLLLIEEIGELARAIRKDAGLRGHAVVDEHDAAHELADVQLYVLHLANVLGIDLGSAVKDKERINRSRQEARLSATG